MLFRRKRTSPAVATVKPRPTMTSLAERRVMTRDMAKPTTAPAASAANVARPELPVFAETITATSAPANIMDSRPRLTRPPIRLTRPPMAASRIGVVIISAAWRKASITAGSSGGSG
jgi:hypothetical protein